MSRITIVSPAPIHGSGGISTILNYAKALTGYGHDVAVSFLSDGRPIDDNISSVVEKYYGIAGFEGGQLSSRPRR